MTLKPSSSFMKVLLLLAVFSLAPVTMYTLYTRTGGPASQKEMVVQKNLRYAFMGGVDGIDLTPMTPWPWVKVCAVTSGVSLDELTQILGFEYKDFEEHQPRGPCGNHPAHCAGWRKSGGGEPGGCCGGLVVL